jgi:hypothetical protein
MEIIRYLFGKRSEVQDMDVGDILLTKVTLDIHRKRSGKRFIRTPLFSIKQIHPLDRSNTLRVTEKRVAVLGEHKEEIKAAGVVDRTTMAELLPSISWIKVVKEGEGSYIAYEGNGRLGAMQQVFCPEDGITVEVEEYLFRKPEKIIRRMKRVRKFNRMEG